MQREPMDWSSVATEEPRLPPNAEEVRSGLRGYPTLPELAKNLALLLSLHDERELHKVVVGQVIKGACWWSSNELGKYDKCRYWSKRATATRDSSDTWKKDHKLVHEHVVPRKVIEDLIFKSKPRDAQQIERFLKLSFVCIVSEADNQALRKFNSCMPESWEFGKCPWARYTACDIEWTERAT